jgi:hypothetical protein
VGSAWIAGAAALILALALLSFSSSSASAAPGHSVLRTFSTGANTDPRAIAADSSGNVYLAEMGGKRIEKFDPAGNPSSFVASASYIDANKLVGVAGGPFPEFLPWRTLGLTVDSSGGPNSGNIYLAIEREGDSSILVYAATGMYLGRLGPAGGYRCGGAVNPSDGSVYFGQNYFGGPVRYPAPSAPLEAAAPTDELQNLTGCSLTVDGTGSVYVGNGPIAKYPASQFGVATPSPSLVFEGGGATALSLDPGNGDLYADRGSDIVRWNAAGVQQGAAFGQLNSSTGIAVDGSHNVSAVDSGGGVFVFGSDEVQLPIGITGGPTNVTPTGADVEGSVDPDGAGNITACEFRFGEDTGYSDGSVPCGPGAPILSPTSVSAHVSGLVSNTIYHYRLFLINANGTQMSTGDRTFSTPPATEGVSTAPASEVKKDGAVLHGSYLGDGQDVHYFFEWAKSTGYGHTTPALPGGDAGTGTGPQDVAPIQVSGLVGGATYHYRLVVSTASGITRGQDESFTTPAAVTNLKADAPIVVTDTTAALRASFDGDGTYETHYYFEWGPTTAYGNTAPAPPGNAVPPGNGTIEVPPVTISNLEKDGSTYHFRVIATNPLGTTISDDRTFKTATAPLVSNLNTRNVKDTSAELTGEVNPRYGQTAYHFEWGPTATYGNSVPIPAGSAGSGDSLVQVSGQIDGLTSGLTYHFRLVASNQYGTTFSPDQTFGFYPPACPNSQLRQETRSNSLPDCRAYELVTPSFAQGAAIMADDGPTSGVAVNPPRIAYGANFGLFPASSGEGMNGLSDLYVSTRSDLGWNQRYVGLSGTEGMAMGGPPGGVMYSPTQGVYPSDAQKGTQASPSLDRVIDYNWGYPGNLESHAPGSNAPYVWNATSGQLIERWPTNLVERGNKDIFVGVPQASADFSHFIFSSNVAFAEGGVESAAEIICCPVAGVPMDAIWPRDSIYDNDVKTGAVALASRKADETPFQGRVFNVSDDGSHILMAEEAALQGGLPPAPLVVQEAVLGAEIKGPLYLRVDATRADARTYEIAPESDLQFVGSTADGATVYFTSADQLTSDDHDSSRDLFVWHESEPNSLSRVSVGDHGSAGNTDACSPKEGWTSVCGVGTIGRLSGNGHTDSYLATASGAIYFESPEQLVGSKGRPEERNLYLYKNGTLRYVTTMESTRGVVRMQVTGDGKQMALVTTSSLTDYESAGHREMYSYSPQDGLVSCVSCRSDGAQPVSDVSASQNGLFLTNDGRTFFSTTEGLVPRDTNQVQDVYEFTEGRAQLITAGIGPGLTGITVAQRIPGLVGVSANGTDVYFATIDTLVTQDHNAAQIKIYDARTGGGFPAEREEPKCLAADECHGPGNDPPAIPADRTSAGLGGPLKTKAHKAKKHKKAKRHLKAQKKKAGKGKAKRKSTARNQGGKRHG